MLLHSVKNYRQGKEAQLSAAQATKLDTIHNQVVNCLRKIPPNGETFVKCVLQALRKETVWIQWKLDKCPQAKGGKGAEGASALLEQHAAGQGGCPGAGRRGRAHDGRSMALASACDSRGRGRGLSQRSPNGSPLRPPPPPPVFLGPGGVVCGGGGGGGGGLGPGVSHESPGPSGAIRVSVAGPSGAGTQGAAVM